jgi:phosphonate transport system substrate-binding protein
MRTLHINGLQRRHCLAVLGAAGLVSALPRARAASASRVLRLAVVPQLTPVEMTRNWMPLLEALGRDGVACELIVYPSIAAFEPEFLGGRADVVFLNPYHMVMAYKAHGYLPLLHDARPLEGVLVVKQGGPVSKIEQLRDHRISFPAPNAFAASLYPRSVLDKQYRLPFEAHYAGNHRNAIRQVLSGDSAAAGAVKTTLEKEPLEVQEKLQVIYTTPPLNPHPLAVHPRVPKAVQEKLVQVFLQLGAQADDQPLLQAIQMPHPVVANYQRDYAALDRMKIEKYVVSE